MAKIVILMASKGDLEHCHKISKVLENWGVDYVFRIASAHKVPLKVMEIIKAYEKEKCVFITVAGRSNALSGVVDANTDRPVISCPPYADKFAGADLFSSIRMPSGVCPLFILEPEEAALAAVKILALCDTKLSGRVRTYQEEKRKILERDDKGIQHG
ncbi:MAG: AIR carboxylase family protein [Chlamydiae bacterium]|nr:AIR carboxylase family protein [Chlamydiota bacterium]MBI3266561.1 AIR carboxylase family protein [Chlamydiota bacterium]